MGRWKEHYEKISQQWSSGVSLSKQESNIVWENIRLKKEEGGYPWTHLSHHQDEEVWLNPQKLPQDIGSVTLLRKDNTLIKAETKHVTWTNKSPSSQTKE